MLHSMITQKGQTTIPSEIRKALRLQPGDRLLYELQNNQVIIRLDEGLAAFKGALAGKLANKGKGMSFAKVRRIAAQNAKRERMKND